MTSGKLQGALLAAGRGERLRGSVGGLPKPLVRVAGEPLLIRQARLMSEFGAAPIYAVVNSETARLIAENSLTLPAGLELLVRDTPTSMESLFALGERLEPGRFFMATVDAVASPEDVRGFLSRAVARMEAEPGIGVVLGVVRWRGDARPLFARITPEGLIKELGEAAADLVTAGFYLLSTRIFTYVGEARCRRLDSLRRFLGLLLEADVRMAADELSEVIDVDEAKDLETVRSLAGGDWDWRETGASASHRRRP